MLKKALRKKNPRRGGVTAKRLPHKRRGENKSRRGSIRSPCNPTPKKKGKRGQTREGVKEENV